MKITKTQLKQLIKEELEEILAKEAAGYDPYETYGADPFDFSQYKAQDAEYFAKRKKEKAAEQGKADLDAKCKDVRDQVAQLNFEYSGGGGTQQTQGMGNPALEQEMNKLILGSPDCFDEEVVARATPVSAASQKSRSAMGMKGRTGSAGYRLEEAVMEQIKAILDEKMGESKK